MEANIADNHPRTVPPVSSVRQKRKLFTVGSFTPITLIDARKSCDCFEHLDPNELLYSLISLLTNHQSLAKVSLWLSYLKSNNTHQTEIECIGVLRYDELPIIVNHSHSFYKPLVGH